MILRRLGWIVCLILFVQEASAVPQWAFRISFTDKTGSPALSNPAAFLSARALSRRSTQNATVTDSDRPVSPNYLDSVLSTTAGRLHTTSRWFNNCVVLLTDSTKILLLQSKPFIQKIEWLGYFAAGLHNKPAPTETLPGVSILGNPANKGTGTPAHYGSSWAQTDFVHGDFLHDHGLYGDGQLIAMLDLGFVGTDTHGGYDSLRARNGIVDKFNFVDANSNVYTRSSHGTTTLSTMAGLIPGSYVGSAPHASYALYLVDDGAYTDALYELDNVIAAIERADSLGADIISASIGYNEFVFPFAYTYPKSDLDGHTTTLAIAANMAVARGIFFSVSSGNEGGNLWNFLLTPGDADSALTIGSVNSARITSGFSSPGPNSSGRVKPDVCLLGESVAVFTASNTIGSSSGTSVAVPQLSGWAACLRQFKPTISPYELRTIINQSADRYSAPTPNYGYGIPDFKKVLQSLNVPEVPERLVLTVSPNPFKQTIQLKLSPQTAGLVECTLTDINGKTLLQQAFDVRVGTQQINLQLSQTLSSGMYFLKTLINGNTFTNKLNKL